ncbi:MAG: hypothetical protein ACO3I4_02535 [Candidatus Kapaibacteriota bacterium]
MNNLKFTIVEVLILLLLACAAPLHAQTELDGSSGPSSNWAMLSASRTWVPQINDRPNGGFGLHSFFNVNDQRTLWAGFSVLGTGVGSRSALVLNGGIGWWFVGSRSLGAYTFAMSGMGITSNNALTGFDYFADISTTYGLASQVGIGAAVEVLNLVTVHTNVWGLWLTNDGGRTPYGIQLGLTFGGR